MARAIGLAALPLLIGMLSGCAGSPPVHFYQLSAEAAAGAAGHEASGTELRIAVGPISLPEVVDRPQLVVRSGPNQVTLIDEHRWAESLKGEIPRVIAENLSRLLATGQVWSYPQNAAGAFDFRVLVDIQRFESTPGQMAAIDALWTVQRSSKEGVVSKTGRSMVQQPIAGKGYDALVVAHSRALGEISREIAESIRVFSPPGP
jgi:uncharacterized protein